MAELNGKRIAFLTTDMVEQFDLPAFCGTLVEEFAVAPVRA